MKLYEISENYRILNEIIENDETADEESVSKALKELEGSFNEKADNITRIIKNELCLREGLKKEKRNMESRIRTKESIVKRLKEYLITNMIKMDKKKFENERHRLRLVSSKRVIIDGDFYNSENKEYIREEIKKEPDKQKIKNAIKKGEYVKGAKIKEYASINIK